MTYEMAAEYAINRIKDLCGIEKIVLYGSVASGTATPDSDIDIAIILDDMMRMTFLDLEGLPSGYTDSLAKLTKEITDRFHHRLHAVFYWQSEFDEGINLFSGGKRSQDLLNEVGIIKYDFQKH